MRTRFEWDPAKSAQNLRDRGFDFGAAALIFTGFTLERPDARHDYGEPRIIAIGTVEAIALTVVYTDRRDRVGVVRRIISARRSNQHERERYEKARPNP